MTKAILLAILLLVPCAVFSEGTFDDSRKGSVAGGGVGFSPTAKWAIDGLFVNPVGDLADREDHSGIAVNLLIGHGWDERNFIVIELNSAFYVSDFFLNNLTMSAFLGPVWYHYYSPGHKSFFTLAGVGVYYFKVSGCRGNKAGPGYLIGCGIELRQHYQAAVYLSGGKTAWRTPEDEMDFYHSHIGLMFTAVAF